MFRANLFSFILTNKVPLCALMVLIMGSFLVGPSASFILALMVFFSDQYIRSSKMYTDELLNKNSEKFTGDFKKDIGFVVYNSFSRPVYKIYFSQACPIVILYVATVIALSFFQENLFWYFSKKNELFVNSMSALFPTIQNHFDSIDGVNALRAEVLRQAYSVIYAWFIGVILIFMLRINAYTEVLYNAINLQRSFFNRYVRSLVGVVVLSLFTIPYLFILMNSADVGGSKDYVFRSLGAYNVKENNNFFFFLFVGALTPMFVWWICVLLISQFKIYLKGNK